MKMFQCSTRCYNNTVFPFRSVFCASAEESTSALSWLMFLNVHNVNRNIQVTEFAWIFFFILRKQLRKLNFTLI